MDRSGKELDLSGSNSSSNAKTLADIIKGTHEQLRDLLGNYSLEPQCLMATVTAANLMCLLRVKNIKFSA